MLKSAQRPWSLNDFHLGKPIGKGKFGNVYLAKEKKTNVNVALKALFKSQISSNKDTLKMLKKEIEFQFRMKHYNILQLYGYFQESNSLYMILDYADTGSFHQYLLNNSSTVMTESEIKFFFSQLLSAVKYLHNYYIIHRDIKIENILLKDNNRLLLADFGSIAQSLPIQNYQNNSFSHTSSTSFSLYNSSSMSSFSSSSSFSTSSTGNVIKYNSNYFNLRYTMCGTYEYLSPEVVSGDGYSFTYDIWCCGIILYEMIYKKTPFSDDPIDASDANKSTKVNELFKRILSYCDNLTFPINNSLMFPEVSQDCLQLIKGMLKYDKYTRLSIEDIINDPWISEEIFH